MHVAEAIALKRAVRDFNSEPIPEDDVREILNAGRRAQSAKNRQLWNFIAIQDRDTLHSLAQLGTYAGHLAEAALGVLIVTPDPSIRWSIMFDAGQAAAYMQLAAWEKGIGSCLATIYHEDAARVLLGIPHELRIHVAISFGFPKDPKALSASPRGRGRKAYDDVVHYEKWNQETGEEAEDSLRF